MQFSNKDRYFGQWAHGMRDGVGALISGPSGKYFYIGT